MASLLIFHHNPRKTFLHRLDPRLKLVLMAVSASVIFVTPGRGLPVIAAGLAAAMAAGRVPALRILKNGLPLWILIGILFLSRAAGTPGLPAAAEGFLRLIPVTREGLRLGARDAGRLVLLVFLGHLFISVTPVSDIRNAVRALINPLAALLMGLSFTMIPELLDTAEEIFGALACRGLSLRRHPYRSLLLFGSLFARKTASKAGRVAEALEARNYRHDRSWKPMKFEKRDLTAALFTVSVLAAALLF